jgi:TetR/AcrR family transcriptional regulator
MPIADVQPVPEMRDRILAEATRQFATGGYESTTIQAIAEAVGIRAPSVLHHFPSKLALREQVVANLMGHWKDQIPRLLTAARTGEDRLSSALEALVQFLLEDPNRARLAMRELLDRPAETRGLIVEHLLPWMPLVTDYIRLGQQTGVVRQDVDPDSYVIQVIIMAISTVALGDVVDAAMGRDKADRLAPMIREVLRIARDSLFVEGAS